MDAILTAKAERLAGEMATQARTLEDLNGLMRSMMKSALERMLNTELDVQLGRRSLPALLPNLGPTISSRIRRPRRQRPAVGTAATAIRGSPCKATWANSR